jgi:hypothetical protein
MTESEIEIVGKLADMLRAKGVRSIDVGGCKMELGSMPAKVEQFAPKSSIPEPDVCKCGHREFEHMNGFCSLGCEPEKCMPKVDG